MAVTTGWYANGLKNVANGSIDLDTSSLKIALLTSGYTLNADTHEFFDTSCNANETTGTGYTDGGNVVAGAAVSLVDSSAATAWAISTAYDVGDIVRATSDNGFVYRCLVAGTSAGADPTGGWTTVKGREQTSDNGVIWECLGTSFVKFDFTDPSWTPNTTISAAFAVVYVNGTAGTGDYLVGYIDFGQTESSSNGDFDIVLPGDGMLQLATS